MLDQPIENVLHRLSVWSMSCCLDPFLLRRASSSEGVVHQWPYHLPVNMNLCVYMNASTHSRGSAIFFWSCFGFCTFVCFERYLCIMYFLVSKVTHSWFIGISINRMCYCWHNVGPAFDFTRYLHSLSTLTDTPVHPTSGSSACLQDPTPPTIPIFSNLYSSIAFGSISCMLTWLDPWYGATGAHAL